MYMHAQYYVPVNNIYMYHYMYQNISTSYSSEDIEFNMTLNPSTTFN